MNYKATLNLPKTTFPMKAELPKREPEMLGRWERDGLYGLIRESRKGGPRFVLHDGPPYANGEIHIGHALNKILKDIVLRYKTLRGFDTPYVPGWDCHGMPIEHQLMKERKLTKQSVQQVEFRRMAREYAERFVSLQREQFKRLGILGEWDTPYLTMAPEYTSAILGTFRDLVREGYVYRGKKPVYWCITDETALAEAEVEYEDRTDEAVFVKLEIPRPVAQRVAGKFVAAMRPGGQTMLHLDRKFYFLVWTTTPWTLPANVAIAVHPQADYQAIEVNPEETWILAAPRAAALREKLRLTLQDSIFIARGEVLAEAGSYQRPYAKESGKLVLDEFVSMDEGTGIVHIAPGHGHEDYQLGTRENLPVFSPVDHRGRYTDEVPEFLKGKTVWESNKVIITDLGERQLLVLSEPVVHSYPHCWRCKKPVIFRATPQWFLNVQHQELRSRLLQTAKAVAWFPAAGVTRMTGMLETRPDWCLSRQRLWGCPIPVLHCQGCGEPLTDVETIEKILASLRARGVESWFTDSPEQLAPGARCKSPKCAGSALRKETDILDVWFDSGVSHVAVLEPRGLGWPADLYLEGSDQHRGWFQVSLITGVALRNQAPFRQVLTHGFVVDGSGRKMSKSLGNVVAPKDVMQRYGADILRLWVALSDYREDVRISEEIIGQVAESYRKIRNTFRYLLANLYDFHPSLAVAADRLTPVDRWMLSRADALRADAEQAYEAYQFHEAVRALYRFCVTDLSSFYLDAMKDRLYTEAPNSPRRRCAQTSMYAILLGLVKTLSPVLAMTADEVWQQMREAGWVTEPSVHLSRWPEAHAGALPEPLRLAWEQVLALREPVMKSLEEQRLRQVIGSPLEAAVTLVWNDRAAHERCAGSIEDLAEAFVVSKVATELAQEPASGEGNSVPGLVRVIVDRAPGEKCQRCWKYLTSVGNHAGHPQLCDRCARVVNELALGTGGPAAA